jgi:hypothetical protein
MNLAKKSIISVFNYCFVCYLASDLSADIGLRQIILPSQLDALYSFLKQLFCRLVVNFFKCYFKSDQIRDGLRNG